MKVAAVVILYNPDEDVVANIMSYSFFVAVVYALDNSEYPKAGFGEKIKSIKNCIYISDNENKGIGARLNQAANLAIENGYEWLLTMDQDSSFGNCLEQYLACCNGYTRRNEVALFGVQHENEEAQSAKCLPVSVTQLITSGSLFNLSLFQQIGKFNESLFIDQVDFEYCYRAIQNKLSVVRFDNIFLKHQLGKTTYHRSLKTFEVSKRSLHSPTRLYYMVRNFLYMRSKYGAEFKKEIEQSKKDILNRIKNNILYNKKKVAVLRCVILAVVHYRKNRYGKL